MLPGSGRDVGAGSGLAGASATFAAAYAKRTKTIRIPFPRLGFAAKLHLFPAHQRRDRLSPIPLLDDLFGVIQIVTMLDDHLYIRERFLDERGDQFVPLPCVGRRILLHVKHPSKCKRDQGRTSRNGRRGRRDLPSQRPNALSPIP